MKPPLTDLPASPSPTATAEPTARWRAPSLPMSLRRVCAVSVVLGMAFLVLAGGGSAIYFAGTRLLDLSIAWVIVGLWGLAAVVNRQGTARSSLGLGFVAVVAAFAVSTITSRNPYVSLEYTVYAIVLIALYLVLRTLLTDPVIGPRIMAAIPILCLVVAAAYIVIVVWDWIGWWQTIGRISTPTLRPRYEGLAYGNPSIVMAVVVALLASSFAALGVAGRRLWLLAGLTLIVAVASFMTGSRGGALAMAVATFAVLAAPAFRNRRAIADRLRRSRAWQAAFGLGAMTLIATLAAFGPTLLIRAQAGGDELRGGFYLASVRMFQDAPFAGVGPGMWAVERIRHTFHPETDYYIPHAHNLVFQTLAELGVLGVLAGVVILVVLIRLIVEALQQGDPVRRRWAIAAVFTLTYLVVHQMFDLYMNAPAVLFVGALPIAVLDAERPSPEARAPGAQLSRSKRNVALVVGGLVIALSLPWMALNELRAYSYEQAINDANLGAWTASLEPLRTIVREEPERGSYQLALCLAEARAGSTEAAEAACRVSAEKDDLPQAWLNTAALEMRRGDDPAAAATLAKAFRIGRQHAAVAYPIGALRMTLGDVPGATEAYGAAIAALPGLAAHSSWRLDRELADRYDEIVASAIEQAEPERRWAIALSAGWIVRARTYIPDLPQAQQVVAALVTDVYANSQPIQRLWAYIDEHPLHTSALDWGTRLAGQQQDAQRVRQYRARAEAIDQFGSNIGSSVGIEWGDVESYRLVMDNSDSHGLYVYRRSFPSDLLVPWLPHLVRVPAEAG